jgi:hypothetical protein
LIKAQKREQEKLKNQQELEAIRKERIEKQRRHEEMLLKQYEAD